MTEMSWVLLQGWPVKSQQPVRCITIYHLRLRACPYPGLAWQQLSPGHTDLFLHYLSHGLSKQEIRISQTFGKWHRNHEFALMQTCLVLQRKLTCWNGNVCHLRNPWVSTLKALRCTCKQNLRASIMSSLHYMEDDTRGVCVCTFNHNTRVLWGHEKSPHTSSPLAFQFALGHGLWASAMDVTPSHWEIQVRFCKSGKKRGGKKWGISQQMY